MGDLRCCVFNPLSMVQANRDQDCLEQFRACHIVGLVGANRKHDLCIQQTRLGPFARLQRSKDEPSTGLELWVHRRCISPKHFRGHWSGEQGRVGAATPKTPQLDILGIVAYLPPKGAKPRVSEKSCRWIMCEVVSAQGHRCVPLVFLDGNAHLGLDKVRGPSMCTRPAGHQASEEPMQRQRTRMARYCAGLRSGAFFALATLFSL